MNVDEKIRAALRLEPSEDVARAGEWDAFELRARRAKRRLVTRGSIATVVLALLSISVAAALERDDGGFARQLEGRTKRIHDSIAGFSVNVPSGWETAGHSGARWLTQPPEHRLTDTSSRTPKPFSPTARGLEKVFESVPNGFAVVIQPQQPLSLEGYKDERAKALGYPFGPVGYGVRTERVADRTAFSMQLRGRGGALLREYLVPWRPHWILRIDILAGSSEMLDLYAVDADSLVRSLAEQPVLGMAEPRSRVAPTVPDDRATRQLLRFLDARLTGSGADRFMRTGLRIDHKYITGINGSFNSLPFRDIRRYVRYEVTASRVVDARTREFDVNLFWGREIHRGSAEVEESVDMETIRLSTGQSGALEVTSVELR